MSVRSDKDRAKQIQDRCQRLLTDLLKDDDNKYCVDCDAKGPRWASWNLGVFLCIRCAGIHRNLGVHISKVKSVNLDSWTPEQVVSLQQMGNSRARAVYEANLPDAFRRPQTDSALEAFVRAKYEHRKYIAREWVPPEPPVLDWDKEIDREMERQKKKKSSATAAAPDKKPAKTSDAVPRLLPKPKSSVSPKPGRSAPEREADLLGGTDASAPVDDAFGVFLSAEVPPLDLKSEEESFFNQPAPCEKEKSKMTKDSIMALYGQAPLNVVRPFQPFPPLTFQTPNGPFLHAPAQPQSFPGGFGQTGGAFAGAVQNANGLSRQLAGMSVGQPKTDPFPGQPDATPNGLWQ